MYYTYNVTIYEWDNPLTAGMAIVERHVKRLLFLFISGFVVVDDVCSSGWLKTERTKPVFILRQMLHFFEILLTSINDVIVVRLRNDYLLEFTIFFSKSIMLQSKNHIISFSFWGLLHYYCTWWKTIKPIEIWFHRINSCDDVGAVFCSMIPIQICWLTSHFCICLIFKSRWVVVGQAQCQMEFFIAF